MSNDIVADNKSVKTDLIEGDILEIGQIEEESEPGE